MAGAPTTSGEQGEKPNLQVEKRDEMLCGIMKYNRSDVMNGGILRMWVGMYEFCREIRDKGTWIWGPNILRRGK